MFDWLDDDDDENTETDADEEEDDEDDNDPAAIEASFREQRAALRANVDTADLRRIRRNLQNALAGGNLDALVAARAGDLVEIIDDRIAELRARQMTDRPR